MVIKKDKQAKLKAGNKTKVNTKTKKYSIGVAIRTWNEAAFLGRCIDMLKRQKSDLIGSMEILVIDSYSTDGTIEISEREGCSLIEIPKEEFNYGGSLNSGIELLKKDLILILSAHAIPQSENFLHELNKPFEDPKVAGTYSRQDPWPNALFIEKVRIAKTFDKQPRTFTTPGNPEIHFSNVASCIRRTFWVNQKFQPIPSSEDFFWAEDMLKSGYKILYIPSVSVYHSHNDSCSQFARRNYNILRNDLVKKKYTPLRKNILVLRAAGSHVKDVVKICIFEQGFIKEKLNAVSRSILEFILIMKYHYKYRKN
jgi:rhamnosyltransferase